MEKRSNENTSRDYLDYLKNKNNILEIYNLIRSKKYSKNQIRTKLRNYLNNPEDLNEFLHSILDSKTTKKEEPKETGAISAGAYSGGQLFSPQAFSTKENVIKTVRESLKEIQKVETKEATSSSSSGQYSQPAIWAKSTSKKDWKGASTKYMPGAKRVQVRSKCKKFPYCNQGDIKALKIFESETVQNAIDSVSSGYGYNKDYISKIVFREIEKRQN